MHAIFQTKVRRRLYFGLRRRRQRRVSGFLALAKNQHSELTWTCPGSPACLSDRTGRSVDRAGTYMNYFYILESQKDKQFYYGSTDNLTRRYQQHVNGKVESTAYRLPVNLVYYEAYLSLSQARKRERQVKANGSVRMSVIKRIR